MYPFSSSWLASNEGAIRKLAQAIYDSRAFDRLPQLADALQAMAPPTPPSWPTAAKRNPHVRGCWVVDLLLGRN